MQRCKCTVCCARGDCKRHTQMHFLIAFGLPQELHSFQPHNLRQSTPYHSQPPATRHQRSIYICLWLFLSGTGAVILMNSRVNGARTWTRRHICRLHSKVCCCIVVLFDVGVKAFIKNRIACKLDSSPILLSLAFVRRPKTMPCHAPCRSDDAIVAPAPLLRVFR